MNSDIGIVTQARTGSSRLPEKVFLEIEGKSLLAYHCDRLKETALPLFIATTTSSSDDKIRDFATNNRLSYYRGSENDVLSRFYGLSQQFSLKHIVRVTSDCPLIDPQLIKQGVSTYLNLIEKHRFVYLSNTIVRTFPRGMDFEIFSAEMLQIANEGSTLPGEREHVTPFIWRQKIEGTQLNQLKNQQDWSAYRLTVDTQEDFELIKILIENYKAESLSVKETINILENNPDLQKINTHIKQKKIEE